MIIKTQMITTKNSNNADKLSVGFSLFNLMCFYWREE